MNLPKRLIALLLCTAALLPVRAQAVSGEPTYITADSPIEKVSLDIVTSAGSAVLLDASGSEVHTLWEQNADKRRGPASTTKIMTALVAAEKMPLSTKVTIPKEAVGIEGSSVYLTEGEVFTLEGLLCCTLLESANDAATAVAIAVGGSIEEFAALMNEKCKELGLTDTHFTNPHGLDHDEHYTTARELGIIAAAAADSLNRPITKILVGGKKDGWHDFDGEFGLFSRKYVRPADAACGEDTALMFFTSGTTGNPKMAAHKHTYALGHYVTAKYWHCCERDGLHLTISDTGWGKSLWGKLYGQWLCEGAVFVYDFDRFDENDILPMFAKYNITTFCAPPTMLRMLIRGDLSKYDLSSIHHMTTAGEALNPEVHKLFKAATGLEIMEGFGQTETTLAIANLVGTTPKIGSMGKASPQFDIDVVDADGNSVAAGETGEIVIRTDRAIPCGLFKEYYLDAEKTTAAWHDGLYHTGDTAWRDEDGYFYYVSRVDDVIKSSGYRIGPFEIESVIMELPYVVECGVSAVPDEVRGQVVKASIVLTAGTEPTDALKKEIQNYVKEHTAPYKYPRVVEFRDSLPKTISGKIQRNKL